MSGFQFGLKRFRLRQLLVIIILMYIFCLITLVEKFQITFTSSGDPRIVSRQARTFNNNTHNCTFEWMKRDRFLQTLQSTPVPASGYLSQHTASVKPPQRLLTCANLSTIKLGPFLGKGVTKNVFQSKYQGDDIAVKIITQDVEDVKACLKRGKFSKKEECFLYANYKLLKEITLSLQLDHPNILKVRGYCVRSELITKSLEDHGVILVSDLGSKVSKNLLKKITWTQKLEHAIQLTDLMDYLQHSPVGSLGIWDFKATQFVLVNGTIKLSDLDDLSSSEPLCNKTRNCRIKLTGGPELTVNCTNYHCHGFNALHNLIKCTQTFLKGFLESPPSNISKNVTDILDKILKKHFNAKDASVALSTLL